MSGNEDSPGADGDTALTRAWIGLGGNIGDVRARMRAALQLIDAHDNCTVEAVSPLYSTPPWGVTNQPDFLNAGVRITTSLAPTDLLGLLKDIERQLKRETSARWGPRIIDLDILLIDGVELETNELTVPHKSLLERAFALLPLRDLDPDLTITGQPIDTWIEELQLTGATDGIVMSDETGWEKATLFTTQPE